MRFLIDAPLSPLLAERLRAANHDAVHVREYAMQKANDDAIFDRAEEEDRAIVSADTDFGTLLAIRRDGRPFGATLGLSSHGNFRKGSFSSGPTDIA